MFQAAIASSQVAAEPFQWLDIRRLLQALKRFGSKRLPGVDTLNLQDRANPSGKRLESETIQDSSSHRKVVHFHHKKVCKPTAIRGS